MVWAMPQATLITIALLSAALAAGCGERDDDNSAARDIAQAPAAGPAPPAQASAPAVAGASAGSVPAAGVLTGTLPRLNGEPDDLSRYRGEVVLVVNTASECGFTPQFEGLERLYRERKREGLVILGFPADDVVGQEPRSNQEIAGFCKANFGVSFPMFSKSNVVDEPVNPLFASLAASLGEPTYNFNKYLLDRRGRPVQRFEAGIEPDDPRLVARIEELLES